MRARTASYVDPRTGEVVTYERHDARDAFFDLLVLPFVLGGLAVFAWRRLA